MTGLAMTTIADGSTARFRPENPGGPGQPEQGAMSEVSVSGVILGSPNLGGRLLFGRGLSGFRGAGLPAGLRAFLLVPLEAPRRFLRGIRIVLRIGRDRGLHSGLSGRSRRSRGLIFRIESIRGWAADIFLNDWRFRGWGLSFRAQSRASRAYCCDTDNYEKSD